MKKIKEMIEKMLSMTTEEVKEYGTTIETSDLKDLIGELKGSLRWNDLLSVEDWKNYDRLSYYMEIELDKR